MRWYDQPPEADAFAAARGSGTWARRLDQRLATLADLTTLVTPVDSARLLLCHRDLHPGNVVGDTTGGPVVLDWDNLGPADPARELAQALFDWWCDPHVDADAMLAMYDAYVASGGPGRVTEAADFTMLVAVRLNFLLVQLNAWSDESLQPEHRAWAEQEIDEALRILPTPAQLAEVLTLTRACARG
jgi:Ser/Thr protein kinase RdoA (MazF antagonist)